MHKKEEKEYNSGGEVGKRIERAAVSCNRKDHATAGLRLQVLLRCTLCMR